MDKTIFADSLTSLQARMGKNDKLNNTYFDYGRNLSGDTAFEELYSMYSEQWIAAKMVDIIADDATREFIEITDNIDATLIDELYDKLERLNVKEVFRNAIKLSRIFGTSYVILKIEDGKEDEEPLDETKQHEIGFMKAIDPMLLKPAYSKNNYNYTKDPYSDNFGFPEYYQFANIEDNTRIIHHSRILRFDCIKTPHLKLRQQNYISDSILKRCYKAIRNFTLATDATAGSVFSANVDVLKIDNLRAILSNPDAEDKFIKAQMLSKQMESINSVKLLDKNDEIHTKNATFSGLSQVLDSFALHLASASDVPATKLFGSAATGFNATGEGDRINYQNTITTKQQEIKPHLNKIFKLLTDSQVSFTFKPLEKMSEAQIADLQLKNAQRDQTYLQNNIVSEATVAKQLKNEQVYNNIDDDIKDIENGLYETDFSAENQEEEQEQEQGQFDNPKTYST